MHLPVLEVINLNDSNAYLLKDIGYTIHAPNRINGQDVYLLKPICNKPPKQANPQANTTVAPTLTLA